MNNSYYTDLILKLQEEEICSKYTSGGNDAVYNKLIKCPDVDEVIDLYRRQVVEVSYIMADINWGREPKKDVKIVSEIFTDSIINNMVFLNARAFNPKFSSKMSSGYYGKLD